MLSPKDLISIGLIKIVTVCKWCAVAVLVNLTFLKNHFIKIEKIFQHPRELPSILLYSILHIFSPPFQSCNSQTIANTLLRIKHIIRGFRLNTKFGGFHGVTISLFNSKTSKDYERWRKYLYEDIEVKSAKIEKFLTVVEGGHTPQANRFFSSWTLAICLS